MLNTVVGIVGSILLGVLLGWALVTSMESDRKRFNHCIDSGLSAMYCASGLKTPQDVGKI